MSWTETSKASAERDKLQRERIERWAETTDLPLQKKYALVELIVGFDKAKFMSQLPSEDVHKLMALLTLRLVAEKHPTEKRKEALERFCANAITSYLEADGGVGGRSPS